MTDLFRGVGADGAAGDLKDHEGRRAGAGVHGGSDDQQAVVFGAVQSGERAWKMSGLGPSDMHVVQIYDSFTITVLLSLEALGFCGRGEAGPFVSDGKLRPGGGFALNTSGGGLSYTHPGMFGIFLLIEAVRQLRGECGVRQVPGARTAVCHGTGGILAHNATLVLGAGL